MADLKTKAEQADYQPTDEEMAKLLDWLSKPNTFLDEGHLQKMYDFPEGSAWDFLLHALGKKKIPTPKERIEKNYLSYIHTYDFTDEQIVVLKKSKTFLLLTLLLNEVLTRKTFLEIRFTKD